VPKRIEEFTDVYSLLFWQLPSRGILLAAPSTRLLK
jgi:hypothetical protein